MPEENLLKNLPPQKNVLTLEEAESKTNYWREAIKLYYNEDQIIPRGFFLPLEDLKQIVDDYTSLNLDGIKVYLTFDEPRDINKPMSNEIKGIIVPVKIENGIYKDIIEPVQQAQASAAKVYSIYDVSQPCPPCCDKISPLFGA